FPAPAARGWSFPFREAGGERLAYRVNLETPGAAPDWGAAIALTGRASPAPPPPNPGQLDMRRVLRGQGAAAVLEATAWREVRPPARWRLALLRARAALGASLERHVPRAALPLLEASLLNVTARVPEDA